MDLMESVGLKDRCLNQKQIHTILTDVSYFVNEFVWPWGQIFTKNLTVVLFRLNKEDIRLDFQVNQQMIWNQGHLKNHLLKKKLLMKIVAKKVIFLQAVKMSQTIPIAQILRLVQSQKSTQLIPTKPFPVDFRPILSTHWIFRKNKKSDFVHVSFEFYLQYWLELVIFQLIVVYIDCCIYNDFGSIKIGSGVVLTRALRHCVHVFFFFEEIMLS